MANNKKPDQSKKIRRDLQALRAFAVAAVVLYHLWPERLVGGFTGVDIFFVLSGYLMTVSIMGRLNPLAETGTITIKNVLHLLTEFYARRIKRLVPAALATIGGVLALSALSGNLSVLLTNAKNAVSAATFWQNWFLANDSSNYLQQDNHIVATQHFWSLSLEEQFYLMWPLVLIVSTLITLNIVIYYKRQKITGAILPITLATLMSLAYGVWMTHADPSVAYYSTPARVWELMVGGIIAFLPAIKNYDLKLLLPHAGLVICLYSIFFINGEGFPGWPVLLPTMGAAMIIWAGIDHAESKLAFGSLFRWRPIQWIGDISYSIYLWHWPLIILLPILLHHDINGTHGTLFKIGIIGLSLLIAHLSYKYIEQAVQKTQIKTRYVYVLFIFLTSITVGVGVGLKYYAQNQIDANLKAMHASAINESEICFGARSLLYQKKCGNSYGKDNLKLMSIASSDNMIYSLQKDGYCKYITTSGNQPAFVNNFCTYGDRKSKRTIILLGDSHARQYTNSFDNLGIKNNVKIILLDSIGCRGRNIATTNTFCKKRYDAYKKVLGQYKNSPVIVSVLYLNTDFVKQHLDFVNEHSNGKIYLLKDNPRFSPKQFSICTTMHTSCIIKKAEAVRENDKIIQQLQERHAIDEDKILNLDRAFCDKHLCYTSIGGTPVFHDAKTDPPHDNVYNTHLSATYSYTLGDLMYRELRDTGIINDRP